MTQRLPGISDADATGIAKYVLDGSTRLLGRSSNLLRILSAHTPYLARWFIGFVAAVRQPNVGRCLTCGCATLPPSRPR